MKPTLEASKLAISLACVAIGGGVSGSASAQAAPATIRDVASAFASKDWVRFKTLTSDGDAPLYDYNKTRPLGRMSRDGFLERVRDCAIDAVYVKGEHYQRTNSIKWLCANQPVGQDRCNVYAHGVEFDAAEKLQITDIFRFDEYNKVDCPPQPIRAPAPPAPASMPRTQAD